MLKILGIVFLGLIVLVVGLLVWGFLTGSGIQEDFYEAVCSGDPDQVLKLMDDDTRKQIDRPVLAAWMAHFKERMGALKGLSKSNFSTKSENGVTTSSGTVEFEKGDVRSKLVIRNDKIWRYDYETEDHDSFTFAALQDTTLYRERGKRFFELAAGDDANAAWAMMHPNLQTSVGSLESFQGVMERIRGQVGGLASVKFLSEEFEQKPVPKLKLWYELQWERKPSKGTVTIQFAALRGHLFGYNFNE